MKFDNNVIRVTQAHMVEVLQWHKPIRMQELNCHEHPME